MEMQTDQLPAFSSGRARYLFSLLHYLTVPCAEAGRRGDCSSPVIPWCIATRYPGIAFIQSDALPVCFLFSPFQNTPKGKGPA